MELCSTGEDEEVASFLHLLPGDVLLVHTSITAVAWSKQVYPDNKTMDMERSINGYKASSRFQNTRLRPGTHIFGVQYRPPEKAETSLKSAPEDRRRSVADLE